MLKRPGWPLGTLLVLALRLRRSHRSPIYELLPLLSKSANAVRRKEQPAVCGELQGAMQDSGAAGGLCRGLTAHPIPACREAAARSNLAKLRAGAALHGQFIMVK